MLLFVTIYFLLYTLTNVLSQCHGTGGTPSVYSRMLFYTSMTVPSTYVSSYANSLSGGLNSADQLCTVLGQSVHTTSNYHNDGGTVYKAFLSDDSHDVLTRISNVDYVNINGQCISNNVIQLITISSTTLASLITNELGDSIKTYINLHTGTQYNGISAVGSTCNSWSSNSGAATQRVGQLNKLPNNQVTNWIDYVDLDCSINNQLNLLCVQQLNITQLQNMNISLYNDLGVVQLNNIVQKAVNTTNSVDSTQSTTIPKQSSAAHTISNTTLIVTTIISCIVIASICSNTPNTNHTLHLNNKYSNNNHRHQQTSVNPPSHTNHIRHIHTNDISSQLMISSRLI